MQLASQLASMTGFGSAEGEIQGLRLRIEAKSLNHRFLELKIKLPRTFASLEAGLRALAQEKLGRGAVDIKIERLADTIEPQPLSVDLKRARSVLLALHQIQKEFSMPGEVTFGQIANYPGVMIDTDSEIKVETLWPETRALFENALNSLIQSRRQEGKSLQDILLRLTGELIGSVQQIQALRTKSELQTHEKVCARITQLAETYSIQEPLASKVSLEIAQILDRTDVSEELARLGTHLIAMQATLHTGGPCGRKLEFQLQEIHREINTLGNKVQNAEISQLSVDFKVKLEQIREQVLNIE